MGRTKKIYKQYIDNNSQQQHKPKSRKQKKNIQKVKDPQTKHINIKSSQLNRFKERYMIIYMKILIALLKNILKRFINNSQLEQIENKAKNQTLKQFEDYHKNYIYDDKYQETFTMDYIYKNQKIGEQFINFMQIFPTISEEQMYKYPIYIIRGHDKNKKQKLKNDFDLGEKYNKMKQSDDQSQFQNENVQNKKKQSRKRNSQKLKNKQQKQIKQSQKKQQSKANTLQIDQGSKIQEENSFIHHQDKFSQLGNDFLRDDYEINKDQFKFPQQSSNYESQYSNNNTYNQNKRTSHSSNSKSNLKYFGLGSLITGLVLLTLSHILAHQCVENASSYLMKPNYYSQYQTFQSYIPRSQNYGITSPTIFPHQSRHIHVQSQEFKGKNKLNLKDKVSHKFQIAFSIFQMLIQVIIAISLLLIVLIYKKNQCMEFVKSIGQALKG